MREIIFAVQNLMFNNRFNRKYEVKINRLRAGHAWVTHEHRLMIWWRLDLNPALSPIML